MREIYSKSIKTLLKNTPSARLKLLAAWDGLSTETQIKILASFEAYLPHELAEKALSNENYYVRYLAAKSVALISKILFGKQSAEDEAILKKIESDPSPLVKYAREERENFLSEKPENFYAMPHEKKLARLRAEGTYEAKLFIQLIQWGVKNNKLTDNELNDLLIEYLCNCVVRFYYKAESYCTYAEEDFKKFEKSFKSLWKLISILPSSRTLITALTYLPTATGLIESTYIEQILRTVDPGILSTFFHRKDVLFKEFRNEIFFSKNPIYDFYCKMTAVSFNFEMSYEQFYSLIKEKRGDLLDIIADSDRIRLIYHCAAEDALSKKPNYEFCFNKQWIFNKRIKPLFKKLSADDKRSQLYELALYELAKMAVAGEQQNFHFYLPEALVSLRKRIVQGDVWATFMAFAHQLYHPYHQPHYEKLLFNYLPKEYGNLLTD